MSKGGPAQPLDLGDPRKVVGVVFGCRPEDVAEDVVVTPFVPLKAFRRHVAPEVRDLSPPFFYKGFTGVFGDRRVSVLATGVGPSRVGDCLGFLSLTPARRVLFAGAVGGLVPELAIGEFFLPLDAADGEGYTRYVDLPFPQVVAWARAVPRPRGFGPGLGPFLAERGLVAREGRVFTVGSISFESRENLLAIRDHGYDAVEMELSAFFAAARCHGLQAEALTYVSDLPLGSSLWQEKGPGEEEALRRAYRALPLLALEYLTRA